MNTYNDAALDWTLALELAAAEAEAERRKRECKYVSFEPEEIDESLVIQLE